MLLNVLNKGIIMMNQTTILKTMKNHVLITTEVVHLLNNQNRNNFISKNLVDYYKVTHKNNTIFNKFYVNNEDGTYHFAVSFDKIYEILKDNTYRDIYEFLQLLIPFAEDKNSINWIINILIKHYNEPNNSFINYTLNELENKCEAMNEKIIDENKQLKRDLIKYELGIIFNPDEVINDDTRELLNENERLKEELLIQQENVTQLNNKMVNIITESIDNDKLSEENKQLKEEISILNNKLSFACSEVNYYEKLKLNNQNVIEQLNNDINQLHNDNEKLNNEIVQLHNKEEQYEKEFSIMSVTSERHKELYLQYKKELESIKKIINKS